MKKIPTIYVRDPETKLRYVKNEPHPACGWVFAGDGSPTYKWDGTAVLIDLDGEMWKRREVKAGAEPPEGFDQEGEADPNTGKRVGWVPCDRSDPNDRWHWEAFDIVDADMPDYRLPPGTYELVGPKVQGNRHRLNAHMLIPHGEHPLYPVPTEFDDLRAWLHGDNDHGPTGVGFEGVVWHHADGRMAKIKVKDFPA